MPGFVAVKGRAVTGSKNSARAEKWPCFHSWAPPAPELTTGNGCWSQLPWTCTTVSGASLGTQMTGDIWLNLTLLVVDKQRGKFFHLSTAAWYELGIIHQKEEKGNGAGSCWHMGCVQCSASMERSPGGCGGRRALWICPLPLCQATWWEEWTLQRQIHQLMSFYLLGFGCVRFRGGLDDFRLEKAFMSLWQCRQVQPALLGRQ